MPSTR